MTNVTLALPEMVHERMKAHTEIRWSEVVRQAIVQKMDLLDAMNTIAKKSKLTKSDIEELSKKIKSETFKELNMR